MKRRRQRRAAPGGLSAGSRPAPGSRRRAPTPARRRTTRSRSTPAHVRSRSAAAARPRTHAETAPAATVGDRRARAAHAHACRRSLARARPVRPKRLGDDRRRPSSAGRGTRTGPGRPSGRADGTHAARAPESVATSGLEQRRGRRRLGTAAAASVRAWSSRTPTHLRARASRPGARPKLASSPPVACCAAGPPVARATTLKSTDDTVEPREGGGQRVSVRAHRTTEARPSMLSRALLTGSSGGSSTRATLSEARSQRGRTAQPGGRVQIGRRGSRDRRSRPATVPIDPRHRAEERRRVYG